MSFFSGLMLILPQRLQCAAPSDDLVETDRSLRKCIDRTADEWHALAVGTANVNDTPAFAQMPRGFLCRDEQATHIDGNQLLEIFKRELLNGREDTGARVVHENVNAPKGSDGFG